MFGLSKEVHSRNIHEFYKAGYITVIERDNLIASLYKTYNKRTNEALRITTKADKRELIYFYSHSVSTTTIWLTVHCDFCVTYNLKKGTFTERDTTR